MCPTPVGRVHTRVAILTIPAVLGAILWLITGREDWLVLIGVYLILGVFLDSVVYPLVLRYQPPWMTFVLGVVEFGLMVILANALELDLSLLEAIVFYWVVWIIAALTKIVLLPIWSLTYLESSLEFRSPEWSIPPAQESLPVIAATEGGAAGPGKVVLEASGTHAVPLELMPSPSGVHRRPQEVGEVQT
jgi:prepilin signal peptidase PulO-like enzyme (type II secretory pathway)